MIEGLGESAQLVVNKAERIAGELGNHYIGVEHLFLAILDLEDLGVQRVFSRQGVDTGQLASEVKDEARKFPSSETSGVLLTPRGESVLEAAKREAQAAGIGEITAPAVLLAILIDANALPTQLLKQHDRDVGKLIEGARVLLKEWVEKHDVRTTIEQPELSSQSTLLDTLGRDLTEAARKGKLHRAIGREKELLEIMAVLMEKGRSNPILLGEAGVGKTALAEGLAVLIAEGKVHPDLRSKRIHTVEVGSIVAGTGIVGKLEEKLEALIHEAEKDPDLIIFIDEIHMLVGAGATNVGPAMDAANILKPALSGDDLQCIGATTQGEYRTSIEPDAALARRFRPVHIGEPTPEDTLMILSGLKPKYEEFHGLTIEDGAMAASVELSVRYIGDRRLPAKALDVLNRSCTDKKLKMWLGDFGDLGSLSREERTALLERAGQEASDVPPIVTENDVATVVASWTGIPVGRLREEETERLLNLEALLGARIRGQDEAIAVISQAVRTSRSGMGDPARPIGSFLFLGPTGVGKTALAKVLAGILFDREENMVRIDMSECPSEHDIWKLIGSASGHVDSDRGGMLTEAVKKKPYSVVLFDEVEKAHPAVLDLLLQVVDDGRLTDGLGRPVNFRSTIVIMTSNVGSKQISMGSVFGFAPDQTHDVTKEEVHRDVLKEAHRFFRTEFLNKLDEIVVFNPLSKEMLYDIARLLVGKLPIDIEIDDAVAKHLVEVSYNPLWGARPLRRAIRDYIVEPLSIQRLKGAVSKTDKVRARMHGDEIVFSDAKAKVKQ